MSQLENLRQLTTIVVDTGDIDSIKQYSPTDATTNPSLILKACANPQYKHLIDDAVNYGKEHAHSSNQNLTLIMDKLFINFGKEILKYIPGRVSTEVDAHLSFDIEKSISKARSLIKLYENEGIERERVLIKLASTWEGAQAAKQLEKEGIYCNMTLMFSLAQAIICADAKATLISPFVGRILDWYKKSQGIERYEPQDDPGVLSVTKIYNYYKKFDYKTQIMGASFRNKDQITELAGCDLLTISPNLLQELNDSSDPIIKKLDVANAKASTIEHLTVNEPLFRWMLNEETMATEKLAEGIKTFAADYVKLENEIKKTYHLA